MKRRRQVGEDPQGRPSRQAVSGSGKRETPAVVLSAAGVGNAIRSRSIVPSGGRSAGVGVDPFDLFFCGRAGGWSCLEESGSGDGERCRVRARHIFFRDCYLLYAS